MNTKQFETTSQSGERLLFAVGDWFRWTNPMGIGVTVVGQVANVYRAECGALIGVLLRVEPSQELRDISRGQDTSEQPGLSGNGDTVRVTGHEILREIFAGRLIKLPMVTSADVRLRGNGTLLTLADENGFACAVVLGLGLAEGLARQLAHTTAYPWENHSPLAIHCPRYPTRRIACGATCDMCLAEVDSCASPSMAEFASYGYVNIWVGAQVKVTRRRERDDGYSAAARAIRESHDGQIGTAEDYPPMTCVWLVRFDDGSRAGYNVDELAPISAQNSEVTT